MSSMWGELLDLVLPAQCGGCAARGTAWCAGCAGALGRPRRVYPRVDPGVTCWALGGYDGVRRAAVIAAKERGRRDLAGPLAAALADGVARLRARGELGGAPLLVVPAPTRRTAARVRGGDSVARFARLAARGIPACEFARLLTITGAARDSVGLSASDRRRNLAGRVGCRRPAPDVAAAVVLVDDVITTGATASESVRVLRKAGFAPVAVVTLTAA